MPQLTTTVVVNKNIFLFFNGIGGYPEAEVSLMQVHPE